MTSLEGLILELADALPDAVGGPEDGAEVQVVDAELQLPVESRLDGRGSVRASLPRGRQMTGFDAPLGRLAFTLVRRAG